MSSHEAKSTTAAGERCCLEGFTEGGGGRENGKREERRQGRFAYAQGYTLLTFSLFFAINREMIEKKIEIEAVFTANVPFI